MATTETITLDPATFITDRTELNLDKLGLRVREANWGDAEHELFLVKQRLGEIPADRHPPNRVVDLQLRVAEEGVTSLAEAALKLQQKVGLLQAEGGWVLRELDTGGGYAKNVGALVHTAVLGGLHGWMMGHHQTAPEVTLTLTIGPYFYSTEEKEIVEASSESDREQIWTMTSLGGTAPGLIRVRVKNKNASAVWRGLLAGIESRDYDSATSANLAWLAPSELTRPTGTTESERESLKVARTTLTAGYLTALKLIKAGGTYLTHKGVRRVWVRVYDAGEVEENVELRLDWRANGAAEWQENEPVKVPNSPGWKLLDLGEVRCEEPPLGSRRWEGRILARAIDGAGTVDIHKVFIFPVEQFLKVATPEAESAGADLASTKSEAATIATGGGFGVAWSNPTNAKTSNDTRTTAVVGIPGEPTEYLKLTKWGFALPEGATVKGIVMGIEKSIEETTPGIGARDNEIRLIKGGTVQGEGIGGSKDRFLNVYWTTTDTYVYHGGAADLWGNTWTYSDINSENFGAAIKAQAQPEAYFGVTVRIDHVKMTVYYTTATDPNRLCFAGRLMELRSDGVVRQDESSDVWGRVVPDGALFYLPPSGLENRTARGMIVPTASDLESIADSGSNKKSVTVFYRRAYHFTSEAS